MKKPFDLWNGKEVALYALKNETLELGVLDLGATVQYIRFKTEKGWQDMCLGYDCVEDNFKSGTYCGATIGRTANRIKGAKFTLDGKVYLLSKNEGNNQNHGGMDGFNRRFFEAKEEADGATFTLFSKDGDQGFPGNLTLDVTYRLEKSTVKIEYKATSDKTTLWCPTNHSYFTLGQKGNIHSVLLKIAAEKFTPLDKENIPTGEVRSVKDTPFDFTTAKEIGRDIETPDLQLLQGKGYDHNFILRSKDAAQAYSEETGVKMSVKTDLPCLQLYTANYLNGKAQGEELLPRQAFCLEPQFTPNAVNLTGFESPVLKAGEEKSYFISFVFEAVK